MFDHVQIRVADRAASERFYDTVLATLGVDTTYSTNAVASWHDFMLTEADRGHTPTTCLHIAFASPSRDQVEAFWQAGIDAGHADLGPPGLRPQYRSDYYGAFLRDPDGNSVEAVHHADLRRGHGIVDHIWIRVADVARSRAFYTAIAPAAGLRINTDTDERVSFTAGAAGGWFSFVEGEPTVDLHMAFPGDDDAVRRFFEDATAAGYRANGEPGVRSQYHDGYYAAYVLDPDGNNVEVVNHRRG